VSSNNAACWQQVEWHDAQQRRLIHVDNSRRLLQAKGLTISEKRRHKNVVPAQAGTQGLPALPEREQHLGG
jgi:hypothetical protein